MNMGAACGALLNFNFPFCARGFGGGEAGVGVAGSGGGPRSEQELADRSGPPPLAASVC